MKSATNGEFNNAFGISLVPNAISVRFISMRVETLVILR
jgi:hypothetical protein